MDNEQSSELEFRRRGRFPSFPARRPPRLSRPLFRGRPFRSSFGAQIPIAVAPSPFVLSIQSALAEILGTPVPLTGVLGAATRRALRIFQMRMGLPPTGALDGSTVRALRRAMTVGTAPAIDSPSEDPAEPLAEPGAEEDPAEPQEEYRITQAGSIALTRWGTIHLSAHPAKTPKQIGALLPARTGIYVIHTANGPWYAGQAGNIRERFRSRFSALEDFALNSAVLAGRSITCYLLPAALPRLASFIGRNGRERGFRADNQKGILTALEDHFITGLRTAGKGNVRKHGATASAPVTVSISGTGPAPAWESGLVGPLALPQR